jgi:hypothetical protein
MEFVIGISTLEGPPGLPDLILLLIFGGLYARFSGELDGYRLCFGDGALSGSDFSEPLGEGGPKADTGTSWCREEGTGGDAGVSRLAICCERTAGASGCGVVVIGTWCLYRSPLRSALLDGGMAPNNLSLTARNDSWGMVLGSLSTSSQIGPWGDVGGEDGGMVLNNLSLTAQDGSCGGAGGTIVCRISLSTSDQSETWGVVGR